MEANNKTINQKNQAKAVKTISLTANQRKHLSSHTIYNSLSDSEKKLWHKIVDMYHTTNKNLFASQAWFGCEIGGYSREWVNRKIQKFKRLKMLLVISRGLYWSNRMIPTKEFLKMGLMLTISLNFLHAKPVQINKVTLCDIKSIDIKKSTGQQYNRINFVRDTSKMQQSLSTNFLPERKWTMSDLTPEQKADILHQLYQKKDINPFSPVITDMKAVALTTAGKIDLSEFPDAALLHAVAKLKQSRNVYNRYGFLRSEAMKYCRAMLLPIDWQWKKELRKVFAITEGAPCVVERTTRFPSAFGESSYALGGTLLRPGGYEGQAPLVASKDRPPSADSKRGSGLIGNENIRNQPERGISSSLSPLMSACRNCRSSRHTTEDHYEAIAKTHLLPLPGRR